MQPKSVQPNQLKHHWEIYFFIIPTLILIALFQYYPASSGIFHSLFRWNGSDISEFVGFANYVDLLKTMEFWNSFKLAFILGFWNVIKMIPALLVAVCIHRCVSTKMQFFYRTLFVVPMVIPGLITVLIWRSFFFEATSGYLNQFLDWSGLMTALQNAGMFVTAKLADPADGGVAIGSLARSFFETFDWITAFKPGTTPAWLGDPKLIIIACVVWGFPWVGSFAVLTHLAKLQNISKDVYEAADIDGATWWSRFTKIELPLLMGSIYLLLVFAIIDTIKDAGMIMALAGITGGPGGRATVPALFMLRKAFMDQQMGYACAVGIVLTVVVLLLQKISNMLLNAEPTDRPGKSAWFGILSFYAFIEGYLFFRGYLLPKTATVAVLLLFVLRLAVQLGLLISVPVLLRKFGKPFRLLGYTLAVLCILAPVAGLPNPAGIHFLFFGFALLLMATAEIFKMAIGAIGLILASYGIRTGSIDMMVAGGVFMVLATPWDRLFTRMDKAYLARCLANPQAPPGQHIGYYLAIALFLFVCFLLSRTSGARSGMGPLALSAIQAAVLYGLHVLSTLPSTRRWITPLAVAAGAFAVWGVVGGQLPRVLLGLFALGMLSTAPFRSLLLAGGAALLLSNQLHGTGGFWPGLLLVLIFFPWKALYLKAIRFNPAAYRSKGDLYSAESFALRQHAGYRAASLTGDWGLRFSKHAFIWFILAFAFLPLYLMLIVSLKDNNQFYRNPTTLAEPYHWENWKTAWEMVSPTVANSIFLSTTATCLIVLFGLAGAYFFARLRVPVSSFLWNALLLLMMMPMIANLVPLFILLRDMNLLNTLTALILVGASGGQAFAIFVFRNFISDIPQDLFEAAEIDGANHFQQLKLVVIPLSGPIMGTVAVMQFLGQWNEFVLPLIVMREQARLPVTVQLIRMAGEYIKLWGPLMAGYAIASIPVIILFTFSMKLFVRGLTEGAVKG
ncbi:MAG: ABC transporter permease subunit [Verrucomicrobiota bacterium]|jgi:ABC-type glycerol-3-phosphate transport system permease component|nr:ABC transporter permease subunit [Verrucomicrobiota bacterium]